MSKELATEHPPPDLDFCSRCHEHTDFEWSGEEECWISVCCGARPVEVD